MIDNYKEPLISRAIYSFRMFCFNCVKLKKKIGKVFKNKKEYLAFSHIKEKAAGNKSTGRDEAENITAEKKKLNTFCESESLIKNERLAVYTCIFGGYDMICEPLYKSKMCDYYIITDGDVPKNSTWKKIEPPKPEGFDLWDPSIRNRYYKMHPEVVFPEYKYSLYVDGNVKILTDMYPLVSMMKNKVIGIHDHPISNCFYTAASSLMKIKLVDKEICDRQIDAYRKEGFPEHFGYFECGIILRRHNNTLCKNIMDTWWEQYNTWVKRDQQGIMYSLWKNGLDKSDVLCLGYSLWKSPRFKIIDHNRKHYLVR